MTFASGFNHVTKTVKLSADKQPAAVRLATHTKPLILFPPRGERVRKIERASKPTFGFKSIALMLARENMPEPVKPVPKTDKLQEVKTALDSLTKSVNKAVQVFTNPTAVIKSETTSEPLPLNEQLAVCNNRIESLHQGLRSAKTASESFDLKKSLQDTYKLQEHIQAQLKEQRGAAMKQANTDSLMNFVGNASAYSARIAQGTGIILK